MQRPIALIALCFMTFPAPCQSTSRYQMALITEVKPRQAAGSALHATSYDVSVKSPPGIRGRLFAWRDFAIHLHPTKSNTESL
jgi:hypothetical protein